MKHLLKEWPTIAGDFISTRRLLLLTDYDGTLTEIVERPELAILSKETEHSLEALSHNENVTLGVISGREVSDLEDKVKIDDMIYAGNNGLEIEGPGIEFIHKEAKQVKPVVSSLVKSLNRELDSIPGVQVEDKGLGVGVHYRLVEEQRLGEVREIVERVINHSPAKKNLVIEPGIELHDIRPAVDWDKGDAIRFIIGKLEEDRAEGDFFLLYFGDDLTDENSFRVVKEYENGITVFIGEPEHQSDARYYLESPGEMSTFLTLLVEQIC